MRIETIEKINGVNTVVLVEETELFSTLLDFKTGLLSRIDEETQENIFKGFSFANILFSMSLTAQINWSNLLFIPEGMYPIPVMGKNDENYTLTYANRQNFYMSALGHKNGALQAGNLKKQAVNNCTTINELKTLADGWGFSY